MEHSVRNGVTITSRKRRGGISRRKTKGRNAKLRKFQTPSILPNREFGRRRVRTGEWECGNGRRTDRRSRRVRRLRLTRHSLSDCVRRCGPLKRPAPGARPPSPGGCPCLWPPTRGRAPADLFFFSESSGVATLLLYTFVRVSCTLELVLMW